MIDTNIHPKVAGATAGAAAVGLLAWVLSSFGITVPNDVLTDLVVVGTFLAGYFTPVK